MPGQTITIPAGDGQTFDSYLALPEAGNGPGIVMLQEIFGVNTVMRAAADLFAEEGYVVLVPDLYWRMQPGVELADDPVSRVEAMAYNRRFDQNRGLADIDLALRTLKARPECTGKIGVVGFCLGGRLAFLSAARLPIDVAVCFYGVGIERHLDEAAKITCPIVLHFGALDDLNPPATVDKIRAAIAGRANASIYVYPDVGHAFYTPGRSGYHKVAAGMAHSPTIAVLRQTLGQ